MIRAVHSQGPGPRGRGGGDVLRPRASPACTSAAAWRTLSRSSMSQLSISSRSHISSTLSCASSGRPGAQTPED
eukprot:8109644-Pyramimonas_sp.AAC.1